MMTTRLNNVKISYHTFKYIFFICILIKPCLLFAMWPGLSAIGAIFTGIAIATSGAKLDPPAGLIPFSQCGSNMGFIPSEVVRRNENCTYGSYFNQYSHEKRADRRLPQAKDITPKIVNEIIKDYASNSSDGEAALVRSTLGPLGIWATFDPLTTYPLSEKKKKRIAAMQNQGFTYLGKVLPIDAVDNDQKAEWLAQWTTTLLPTKTNNKYCSFKRTEVSCEQKHEIGAYKDEPFIVQLPEGNCEQDAYGSLQYDQTGRNNGCTVTKKGSILEIYQRNKEVRFVTIPNAAATKVECRIPRTAKHKKGRNRR